MKNCGRHNVRKHNVIKGSDKYVTLDISSKYESMDKIKITSSESNGKFGKISKGVDYLYGFQDEIKVAIIKKARYAIRNVSKKYLSKIIKDVEKMKKLPFEKKNPKQEPTDPSHI